MRILILSCGTGGGHDAAAAALKEELTAAGHEVTCLDPYTLKSQRLSNLIDQGYIQLVRWAPKVFGMLYALGRFWRRLPGKSPIYHLNGRMSRRMEAYLEAFPADLILMTHIFPGQILTYLKHDLGGHVPKMVLVATDYTCHPFMEECDCDAYMIPEEQLRSEFVERGIPPDRIHPLGIPVRRTFCRQQDRAAACCALGWDPGRRYILVACGSMGSRKLKKTVRLLRELTKSRPEVRIAVICGTNPTLYRELREKYGDDIEVIGCTNQMHLYVKACDLYLTKAGGLSTTEAAVSGTLLGLISTIPGCESRNIRFFEKNRLCVRVRCRKKSLASMMELMDRDDFRAEMCRRQRELIHSTAAEDICRTALELAAPGYGEEAAVCAETMGGVS